MRYNLNKFITGTTLHKNNVQNFFNWCLYLNLNIKHLYLDALSVCWKHICLTEAAALSDFCLFHAPCINSLTYFLTYYIDEYLPRCTQNLKQLWHSIANLNHILLTLYNTFIRPRLSCIIGNWSNKLKVIVIT